MGAIGFAYLAPLFFIGPIAGAIADRFGQRRTAIVALVIGILLAATIAGVIYFGTLTPTLMLVFTIIQGIFFAFDFPSRQALIPQMVKRSDISAAIGMNTTTYNTSSFTGPIIGGSLLAFGNSAADPTAGAALGYATFAFANCFMLVGVSRVNETNAIQKSGGSQFWLGVLNDLKSGIKYVSQSRYLLMLMGLSLFFAFCLRSYQNLMAGLPKVCSVLMRKGSEIYLRRKG